jgi:hypothetical protein
MTTQQVIQTSTAPTLVIEQIGGDLSVRGWDRAEILARGDESLTLNQENTTVYLRSAGDCTLQVPVNTTLRLGQVDGDGQIANVQGQITLEAAAGDLALREVGAATIHSIEGDLSAREVNGDLSVHSVSGDVAIAGVRGSATINAGDDVSLTNVAGNVSVSVGDDASLRLTLKPGQECRIQAGGDIACRIPSDASVKVKLVAGGDIAIKKLAASQSKTEGAYEFVLGAGEASLHLAAGGDIALAGQSAPWEGAEAFDSKFTAEFDVDLGHEIGRRAGEFAQQVARQVESQMEALTRQLDEKLARFGNSEEIAARVQQKVQAAVRRAEEKIAEAMREAERRSQAAERQAARMDAKRRKHAHVWHTPIPPEPPRPPKPQASQAADEERMMILRMVEEGKISVEQAEQLLTALKG